MKTYENFLDYFKSDKILLINALMNFLSELGLTNIHKKSNQIYSAGSFLMEVDDDFEHKFSDNNHRMQVPILKIVLLHVSKDLKLFFRDLFETENFSIIVIKDSKDAIQKLTKTNYELFLKKQKASDFNL